MPGAFQSLVGKLETNESGVEMNKRSMFQSLVGKLETKDYHRLLPQQVY